MLPDSGVRFNKALNLAGRFHSMGSQMKLDFDRERVLAVVAHPDDAELLCAGTLARARHDRAAVAICVLCRGDKGQSTRPVSNLAAVRRRETNEAARLLDANLYFGNYGDGTLLDNAAGRLKLVEIFRAFRPTLILAHAPEDYHADHRAAGQLAEAASWACASHGRKTSSPVLSAQPALWWMDTVNMNGFQPGFYVDITAHVNLKERMLACHRSQLARAGDNDFSSLSDLMRRQYQTRGAQAGVSAAEAFRIHDAFKRTRAW